MGNENIMGGKCRCLSISDSAEIQAQTDAFKAYEEHIQSSASGLKQILCSVPEGKKCFCSRALFGDLIFQARIG